MCAVVIAVLAIVPTPKMVGLLQEVPTGVAPELATKKPLSTATRRFVTFRAPPISAWYVVGVTTMVAETVTTQRTSVILAERYQVNVRRARLPIFDALSIF